MNFNAFTPKISILILLIVCHTHHTFFLLELNRFPELSRTMDHCQGLSSPGKCHNKNPGLSRFSRTHMKPVNALIKTRN